MKFKKCVDLVSFPRVTGLLDMLNKPSFLMSPEGIYKDSLYHQEINSDRFNTEGVFNIANIKKYGLSTAILKESYFLNNLLEACSGKALNSALYRVFTIIVNSLEKRLDQVKWGKIAKFSSYMVLNTIPYALMYCFMGFAGIELVASTLTRITASYIVSKFSIYWGNYIRDVDSLSKHKYFSPIFTIMTSSVSSLLNFVTVKLLDWGGEGYYESLFDNNPSIKACDMGGEEIIQVTPFVQREVRNMMYYVDEVLWLLGRLMVDYAIGLLGTSKTLNKHGILKDLRDPLNIIKTNDEIKFNIIPRVISAEEIERQRAEESEKQRINKIIKKQRKEKKVEPKDEVIKEEKEMLEITCSKVSPNLAYYRKKNEANRVVSNIEMNPVLAQEKSDHEEIIINKKQNSALKEKGKNFVQQDKPEHKEVNKNLFTEGSAEINYNKNNYKMVFLSNINNITYIGIVDPKIKTDNNRLRKYMASLESGHLQTDKGAVKLFRGGKYAEIRPNGFDDRLLGDVTELSDGLKVLFPVGKAMEIEQGIVKALPENRNIKFKAIIFNQERDHTYIKKHFGR
jgi:hypothetical protein